MTTTLCILCDVIIYKFPLIYLKTAPLTWCDKPRDHQYLLKIHSAKDEGPAKSLSSNFGRIGNFIEIATKLAGFFYQLHSYTEFDIDSFQSTFVNIVLFNLITEIGNALKLQDN